MEFTVSKSLKGEHEEFMKELAGADRSGGTVGSATKEVSRILRGHFKKEEEFALPPLSLLAPLATRKSYMEMKGVLPLTDRFDVDIYQLLEEHKESVTLLGELADSAAKENKAGYARLAEKLKAHVLDEE